MYKKWGMRVMVLAFLSIPLHNVATPIVYAQHLNENQRENETELNSTDNLSKESGTVVDVVSSEENSSFTEESTFAEAGQPKYNDEVSSAYNRAVDDTYLVTFDTKGGSLINSQYVREGEKVIEPGLPVREGYTFDGWIVYGEDPNHPMGGMVPFDISKRPVHMPLNLIATWLANSHTIAFDANEGIGNMVAQKLVYDEEAILTPNTYTRPAHIFKGWNTEANGAGDVYTDQAKVKNLTALENGQVTLYAQWEREFIPWIVTFDSKGGSPIASQYVKDGEKANEPASPTKEGYIFDKWLIYGEDSEHPTGGMIPFVISERPIYMNTDLEAAWLVNTYTITFDANEGVGDMATQKLIYDEEASLISNSYTRSASTFKGWNTEADGTGVVYADQAKVKNLTALENGQITLYAQWERTPIKTIKPTERSNKKSNETRQNLKQYSLPKTNEIHSEKKFILGCNLIIGFLLSCWFKRKKKSN